MTAGLAVFCKSVLVAAMSRPNCGRADQSNATTPATRGHLVWELRQVVRESSGSELVAARVEDDPGGAFSTLLLWWRSGDGLDSVDLFWSLD